MRSEILGIPIERGLNPAGLGLVEHRPVSIGVSTPHHLEGLWRPTTSLSYATVIGFGPEGEQRILHQVPQLPGRLGSVATNLMVGASSLVTAYRLKA